MFSLSAGDQEKNEDCQNSLVEIHKLYEQLDLVRQLDTYAFYSIAPFGFENLKSKTSKSNQNLVDATSCFSSSFSSLFRRGKVEKKQPEIRISIVGQAD